MCVCVCVCVHVRAISLSEIATVLSLAAYPTPRRLRARAARMPAPPACPRRRSTLRERCPPSRNFATPRTACFPHHYRGARGTMWMLLGKNEPLFTLLSLRRRYDVDLA